jgi:hypothetical protein
MHPIVCHNRPQEARNASTNNQQPATSNQQPATNNQQPTTNNQQPTTNNQQPTTNNQQPQEARKYHIALQVLAPGQLPTGVVGLTDAALDGTRPAQVRWLVGWSVERRSHAKAEG